MKAILPSPSSSSSSSWITQDDYYTTVCSAATLQSDKKGFFQNFADHVTETAGPNWVKKFGELQTDEERISKCFYDDKIYEAVHGPLQNIQSLFRSKCGRIAQQRRLEGERTAQKSKFEKALQLLSQSVIRAPKTGVEKDIDNGISLALALWERSNVLLELKEYQLAIVDIQLAIKEKLPESLRIDAYYRMADCYIGLKEKNKAIVSLNIVSKLSDGEFDWKIKIDNKMKTIQDISEEQSTKKQDTNNPFLENVPPERQVNNISYQCWISEPPQLTDGPNESLPNLSNLLALVSNEKAGRFVKAKQPIKAGDTLAVEEPFVAALLPNKFSSHCLNCFKRVRAAIPCPECSGVAFCSDKCRDVALKTYHKYECHFLDMLLGSGMSILCHIALRIFTRTSLDYFLKLKPKIGVDVTSHPYLRFYDLVSHKKVRNSTDFLHRTLMALFLLRNLQSSGYFGPTYNKEHLTEDEKFVGGLLLHHLQVLQFNAHEIYETIMKTKFNFQSTKLNYIAVGVYNSVAMFNHECYPAVTRYFCGDKIVLKAVRPLEPGENVTENYGPIFTKKSLAERQRSLQSRYWFTCSCIACTEDWGTYEQLNEHIYTVRCHYKECNGTLIGSTENIPKTKSKCPKCGKLIKMEDCLILIKSFIDDHTSALIAMDRGEVDNAVNAINLLCQYTNTVHSICRPPNKDLSLCQEALRSCWALDGTVYYIPQ